MFLLMLLLNIQCPALLLCLNMYDERLIILLLWRLLQKLLLLLLLACVRAILPVMAQRT
jgi:hypothetical protein